MSTTHHARSSVPEWSSVGEAVRLIALGYTFRTCFRVALVVGTPFVVSSIGCLARFRTTRATAQR